LRRLDIVQVQITVLVGLAAFLMGVGLSLAARPIYARLRPRHPRLQTIAGCQDIFPIGVAPFRALVRLAADVKAATLSERYGRPLTFTAQDGEDVLLAELFVYKPDGFYVEIGAYDGVHLSNTYFFEQIGWHGLLIEPLPEQAEACRRNRPGSQVFQAAIGRGEGEVELSQVVNGQANGASGDVRSFVRTQPHLAAKARQDGHEVVARQVPMHTFEATAEAAGLVESQAIDFISIDCEGMDFEVLQSIDLTKWQPRLLLIEHIQPALLAYLAQRGYQPMVRIRANTIFSREAADRVMLSRRGYWQALALNQA
jgi:FkbM family methyltransferase